MRRSSSADVDHVSPADMLQHAETARIPLSASSVFVGCAGWAIAGRFASDFPGKGTHLERYGEVFNAVEINSSFYRSHMPETYVKWRDSVPCGFRFSVKMPRIITHFQRLANVEDALLQFVHEVSGLREKLGCVLIQLPPSLHFEESVAEDFFSQVKRSFACLISFEARHPTWFATAPTAMLTELGITRVIADPAKGQCGAHVGTGAASYRRLHGSPKIYHSSYGTAYVAELANELVAHADLDVSGGQWVIFDNTAEGAATCDALTLRSLLWGANLQASRESCSEKTFQ